LQNKFKANFSPATARLWLNNTRVALTS